MKTTKISFILYFFYFLVLVFSLISVHQRINTTIIGYDIGSLKQQEAQLLKKKSLLTMELSKLTTREGLKKSLKK
tara:strand:+ start:237 stop:461 length:225 start_codon:yes stop_codon:yes gene_type:complete